jgi:hypothetical protein
MVPVAANGWVNRQHGSPFLADSVTQLRGASPLKLVNEDLVLWRR